MNLGTGVVFNFGPEQFYLVSDNLIGAATGNVKNLPFRFGWNHTFGRKKYEKEFGLAAKKADQKKRKAKRKSKE